MKLVNFLLGFNLIGFALANMFVIANKDIDLHWAVFATGIASIALTYIKEEVIKSPN